MNKFKSLFFFFLVITLISSCTEDDSTTKFSEEPCPSGDLENLHLLLGNPSNAQTNAQDSPNNYLLKMDEYAISYSRDRGIPNWVSWHLSEEWYDGDGERQNDFRANPFLPDSWIVPNSGSYSGSGLDRGHNCPSADRLCSNGTNSATFFMTNMVPQCINHNQRIWKYWECYFRYLANQDKELYIIMGNYGQGGDKAIFEEDEDGNFVIVGWEEVSFIQDEDLTIIVPESIWKVAIAIPKGEGNDLEFINGQSTVIAIDVPNVHEVADFDFDDSQFMTTVDEIESKMGLGFDLFSNLPNNLQSALEGQTHTTDPSFTPCW